ncbi:unannotated protein [freshwater metagenome]|uniref:Unannotated protein n=1 Tax=freshwater metagenome TaxID=449393 RepID=A0A6J7L8S3_9ZZZZ
MVGTRERQQPHLFEAGRVDRGLHHLADSGDRALSHRTGDHARLAEAAAPGAAPEDLDRRPLVHGLGEGHEGGLGVGPSVEVHERGLSHAPGDVGPVGHHAPDAAVGQVLDIVKAGHVHVVETGKAQQQLVAAVGTASGLPLAHDLADGQHHCFAVTGHSNVDEVGDGLGVEGGVAARHHHGMRLITVDTVQGDARQVEGREHVRVAELGREAQAQHVERPHRPM